MDQFYSDKEAGLVYCYFDSRDTIASKKCKPEDITVKYSHSIDTGEFKKTKGTMDIRKAIAADINKYG
jgi:hypothetical protein